MNKIRATYAHSGNTISYKLYFRSEDVLVGVQVTSGHTAVFVRNRRGTWRNILLKRPYQRVASLKLAR